MTITSQWDKAAQTRLAAYQALEAVFAQYRGIGDRLWVITGQKWTAEDENVIHDLSDEALFLKQEQWRLMAVPYLETALVEAEANMDALPEDWQRENLKLMRREFTLQRAIETPDIFAQREKLFAAGAQAFNKTEKIKSHAKRWEAQRPLIEAGFLSVWNELKKPAEQLGVSISDLALQRWMPSLTGAQIEEDLAMAESRYPAIVKSALAYGKTMGEPLPLEFPAVPDPDEDPEGYEAAKERYQGFVDDFLSQTLEAAGWSAEELERQNIRIKVNLVPSGGFVMGSPRDITVGIGILDEPNPLFMIKQTLAHEFGHVLNLLEGNRLPGLAGTQLAGALNGFGIHEVAAMTMEESFYDLRALRLSGRLIEKHFGLSGPAWAAENLYLALNQPDPKTLKDGMEKLAIVPGMAWRARAEKWILDSKDEKEISERVAGLPQFYAEQMLKMTGIKHDAAKFIIEEDHWLTDFNMYFYSYIYGAKGAGALMEKMDQDPAIQKKLSQADTLKDYIAARYEVLQNDVTRHASMKTPIEIFDNALGKGNFSMNALLTRLEKQYGVPTARRAAVPAPQVL